MTRWLDEKGKDDDVVISTRIRIARNLKDYKFPKFMSLDESDRLTDEILNRFKTIDTDNNYNYFKVKDLSLLDKNIYVERHLISPSLIQTPDKSSFLLSDNEKITAMINEEDHLRIQCLLPGFNMEEGWKMISLIDDLIEEKVDYAFHYEFGYLTSCPTNVGTGLRASMMLHLPCISMAGNLKMLIEGLRRIGLTVRGIYGEGSKGLGDLYQISNQTTLGESEEEIMNKLERVIGQIITRERNTRNYLYEKKKLDIEDRVFRSLGILKYSSKMSSKEAMGHLSNVKLGVDLGLIDWIDSKSIVKFMIDLQPYSLQSNINNFMEKEERDYNRSKIIKEYFNELEG